MSRQVGMGRKYEPYRKGGMHCQVGWKSVTASEPLVIKGQFALLVEPSD